MDRLNLNLSHVTLRCQIEHGELLHAAGLLHTQSTRLHFARDGRCFDAAGFRRGRQHGLPRVEQRGAGAKVDGSGGGGGAFLPSAEYELSL